MTRATSIAAIAAFALAAAHVASATDYYFNYCPAPYEAASGRRSVPISSPAQNGAITTNVVALMQSWRDKMLMMHDFTDKDYVHGGNKRSTDGGSIVGAEDRVAASSFPQAATPIRLDFANASLNAVCGFMFQNAPHSYSELGTCGMTVCPLRYYVTTAELGYSGIDRDLMNPTGEAFPDHADNVFGDYSSLILEVGGGGSGLSEWLRDSVFTSDHDFEMVPVYDFLEDDVGAFDGIEDYYSWKSPRGVTTNAVYAAPLAKVGALLSSATYSQPFFLADHPTRYVTRSREDTYAYTVTVSGQSGGDFRIEQQKSKTEGVETYETNAAYAASFEMTGLPTQAGQAQVISYYTNAGPMVVTSEWWNEATGTYSCGCGWVMYKRSITVYSDSAWVDSGEFDHTDLTLQIQQPVSFTVFDSDFSVWDGVYPSTAMPSCYVGTNAVAACVKTDRIDDDEVSFDVSGITAHDVTHTTNKHFVAENAIGWKHGHGADDVKDDDRDPRDIFDMATDTGAGDDPPAPGYSYAYYETDTICKHTCEGRAGEETEHVQTVLEPGGETGYIQVGGRTVHYDDPDPMPSGYEYGTFAKAAWIKVRIICPETYTRNVEWTDEAFFGFFQWTFPFGQNFLNQ